MYFVIVFVVELKFKIYCVKCKTKKFTHVYARKSNLIMYYNKLYNI